MRKGFIHLKDLDNQHNELHRKCFSLPYLIKFMSATPTTQTVEAGELVYCTVDNKLYLKDEDGTLRASGAFS